MNFPKNQKRQKSAAEKPKRGTKTYRWYPKNKTTVPNIIFFGPNFLKPHFSNLRSAFAKSVKNLILFIPVSFLL